MFLICCFSSSVLKWLVHQMIFIQGLLEQLSDISKLIVPFCALPNFLSALFLYNTLLEIYFYNHNQNAFHLKSCFFASMTVIVENKYEFYENITQKTDVN